MRPVFASFLPAALAAALGFLGMAGPIRSQPRLSASFVGAAFALLVWNLLVVLWTRRAPRGVSLEIVLRKQHYLQACAQGTVLAYWGWWWSPVYDAAPLLLGQLLFAYAFDMLLGWTRRGIYTLGFGPVPVIFSMNLFLWFKPDWFLFQFLMVATGFAAKDLIRWERDGRLAHIFNPSSFPLALFSTALLLTATNTLTRGQDIAISQFYPPQIYLVLFLVSLPGQFFFGVASMTLAAVFTTYLFGLAYFAVTGTYFFYDSYIPIAVFLGMHLLVTDPSTSPRTELGRVMFGALYGLSAIGLYHWLESAGLPTFYDKLLQVPVLNLSVKLLDRAGRSRWLAAVNPARLAPRLIPQRRHAAYMAIWAVVFVVMSAAGGVGDRHPGQWLPFWERACQDGRARACAYARKLHAIYCGAGSAWACGAAGEESVTSAFERVPPALADYPILLRGSKGPIADRAPSALYARACEQGWPGACDRRP